jgi:hypothetical protein
MFNIPVNYPLRACVAAGLLEISNLIIQGIGTMNV